MANSSRVIVIDVENRNGNNPIFFFPLGRNVTPTYEKSKHTGKVMNPILGTAGSIYGERIILDIDKRTATIIQRMGLKENAELLKLIRNVAGSEEAGYRRSIAGKPAPDETKNISSALELRTWLYWLRRLVDKGSVIREGAEHLPTIEQMTQGVLAGQDVRVGNSGNFTKGDDANKFAFLQVDREDAPETAGKPAAKSSQAS